MNVKLKSLGEQVMVVTGASSGIGLATAKAAAHRGARVVLAARDEAGLRKAVDEIVAGGGQAVYVVADVGDPAGVREVAEAAVAEFGRVDTWVNNAGVSIYGRIEDVPLDDARRLFDVNYWGMVNGSLAAVPLLRERGGALINVGSVVSDRAMPLQGHYAASKHAVKGFTEALRMELEEEGAPVSVTLVKPSAIDTPYPEHARSYMAVEPKHPAPVYAPQAVAEAILECAERAVRDVTVGGGGRVQTTLSWVAPRLMDRVMERQMFDGQMSDRPSPADRPDSLFEPMGGAEERGSYPGHVAGTSAFTRASLHPGVTALALLGAGVAVALGVRAARD
jgi:NAD(P)-dependent dehydrogenase (short-subunit alcohol dehydrogenase family)